MLRAFVISVLFSAAAVLAGCAAAPDEVPTAEELYEEGTDLHSRADYAGAAAKFEELISTYPTSPYSQQAMLDLSYSLYRRGQHGEAADAADRFLGQFPDNPHAPYAIYLKGLAFFREDRGVLDHIGRQDPAARDPREMRFALEAFSELTEDYPESRYAADAARRSRHLINTLARHDVLVGRYYLRRGAHLAAIGRARDVMRTYPDSAAVRDALVLLRDAYSALDEDAIAADAGRLLDLNFPEEDARRVLFDLPDLPVLRELPPLPELPEIEAPNFLKPILGGEEEGEEEESEPGEKAE